MRTPRCLTAALTAALLWTVTGCGAASTAEAAPGPTPGQRYTTRAFAVPFTVEVPASLGSRPTKDTRTFLTWLKSDGDRVRFLLPAAVYRPGRTTPEKPPASYEKYLAFLRGHTDYHAQWRDRRETTVDGHPATLMTGTTDWSLDGTLGCPTRTGDAGDDCYGLQPEFSLRLAVVDLDDRYLVAWTSVNVEKEPDTAPDFTRFETMLRSLRFAPGS
ncbi:hypothetical protein [Streptomyces sp. NPDC053367]|uniref:hypothetical protein n=1 Tax=Streptomyces sp. NPDC053367 TaxID=3365700 RepID=UPI0037D6C544